LTSSSTGEVRERRATSQGHFIEGMTREIQIENDALLESAEEDATERQRAAPRVRRVVAGALLSAGVLAAVAVAGRAAAWRPAPGADVGASLELDVRPCRLGSTSQKVGPCSMKNFKEMEHVLEDDGHVSLTATVCSVGKENCNDTKCCSAPGAQCYAQNDFYAQCRPSCGVGPDPEHWDGQWWSCQELGNRTEGTSRCSEPGEDCRSSKCCSQIGTQCFGKDDSWATCKAECIAGGPDMTDSDRKPWTCEKLGPWTPGASPWVAQQCASDGEDCSKKGCCSSPGMQCYQQGEYWSQCKPECTPGKNWQRPWEPEWSCNATGSRTPAAITVTDSKVSPWVQTTCSKQGDSCSSSKCCLGTDTQCYEKNDEWAMCLQDCTAGRHLEDSNETWTCKPLGPRSHGLALKGSPAIFCWSLIQTTTYEKDLMLFAMSKGAGIFGCDEYAVLSTDNETVIGTTLDGDVVKTLHVPWAPITRSVDGTAGNAKLFMNVWDVIIEDGRWRNHAWILKVDPDAVMIASRVRSHMAPHYGENVYVVNCNKVPGSPNFPMMFGSLEVYSFKAIDTYARNKGLCITDMGMMLPMWGEDYFMTHCLDHIGVGRIADFGVVGDMVCTGANCGDQWTAAFHPFKDVASWERCWNTTMR